MVKRKTSSSHTLQDKRENTTVTEESDMYETGLNEEWETEDLEPTTSRPINQEIESDDEMNDTMILIQVEPPADQAQSDKESLYGLMKSAFQEMTTQVVVAIQTAFRGMKGHTPEKERMDTHFLFCSHIL